VEGSRFVGWEANGIISGMGSDVQRSFTGWIRGGSSGSQVIAPMTTGPLRFISRSYKAPMWFYAEFRARPAAAGIHVIPKTLDVSDAAD